MNKKRLIWKILFQTLYTSVLKEDETEKLKVSPKVFKNIFSMLYLYLILSVYEMPKTIIQTLYTSIFKKTRDRKAYSGIKSLLKYTFSML